MTAWRDKPKQAQNFLKRRSYEQGKAEADAAHYATQRLYCEALRFWRYCKTRPCRRHRRCAGDPNKCLGRNFFYVPQAKRLRAQRQVIGGGPRRMPPASHIECTVRRGLFADLLNWPFTQGAEERIASVPLSSPSPGGGGSRAKARGVG